MNKPVKRCKQLFSLSLFSLSYIFAFQTISGAVPKKTQLQDWQFSPENALLEFTLSSTTQPKYFYLSQPPRLVIDLPSTKLGYVHTQQNFSGTIQRIRLSQLNANVTRIVMDLIPGTIFNQSQVQLQPVSTSPNRWMLRLLSNNYSNTPVSNVYPPQPPIYPPQPPTYQPQPPTYQPQQLTLPPTVNYNPQTSSSVSVPPLVPNNPSQTTGASMLPPASFSTPFGGVSTNTSPLISPNFADPNYPNNNPVNNPNNNNAGSRVVPWGQNLPVIPQQ